MIQKRVNEHAEFVQDKYDVFFTALQGSQNYGLADEESDVDTKSLIIPNLHNLIFDKKMISETLIVEPTEEHADVKDIRSMFECFRKQNPNFIEILFTPYVYVNPRYKDVYDMLRYHNDEISRMDLKQTINATCGHIHEKYKKISHPFPSRMSYIEKYGYDPKQLHHMYRLKEFLIRFLAGESFDSAMISKDPALLKAIKRGAMDYKDAIADAEKMNEWALRMIEHAKYMSYPVDERVNRFLDEITYDVIRGNV